MRRYTRNGMPSYLSRQTAQPAVGLDYGGADQAAQTRFDNDRASAARASLNASMGTSNAVGVTVDRPAPTPIELPRVEKRAPAQTPAQEPIQTSSSTALQAMRSPMTIETSKLFPAPEQGLDLQSFDNDFKLEALVRSPQFQTSVVKTQLQEYFRSRNNPGPGDGQDPGIYAENVLGNMKG